MTGPAPRPAAQIIDCLREIAQGRPNSGKPMVAEDARQLARRTLIAAGVDWPKPQIRKPDRERADG